MSLTPEQGESIEDPTENKLIVALAGSGKTHVTVSYADVILESDRGNSCLMVTFTNAAAGEMGERLLKRLGNWKCRNTRSVTFASLFLRQFRPLAGNRKLIMGSEQLGYVRRVLASLGLNTDLVNEWNSRIDEVGRELFYEHDGSVLSQVFLAYEELLRKFHKVDLNLVSKEVILALQEGKIPLVRESHICVDEYQDTDIFQYEWIKVHALAGKPVCVVGDDDQSIYSWRGGVGYENMVRYQQELGATAYSR